MAVCVLALGVVACSVKDSKAEASASASASASADIARAEKGIADANASAAASREAALTPELRTKRDAALAEPAPAKSSQLNEDSAEGAAASVGYFLNLYRYAFMTGNTTELAAMSEDRCKFCQSTIDDANDIHSKGGWADKWDQEIVSTTVYEKLEGYDYNRVKVIVNYGKMTSYYGDGKNQPPPKRHTDKRLTSEFDTITADGWSGPLRRFLNEIRNMQHYHCHSFGSDPYSPLPPSRRPGRQHTWDQTRGKKPRRWQPGLWGGD